MHKRLLLLVVTLFTTVYGFAQSSVPANSPWVFAGFKGNSEDGVYFALSLDGYHWTLANAGKPVVKQTEPGELMRDPFLQRAPDGSFAMVWTWSWHNGTIGLSTSDDLLSWTPHRQLPVMANEPKAVNTWAPALYWDKSNRHWLIFWSSTIPGRFPGDDAGDAQGGQALNHRIYATTTRDFKKLTPAKVFFDPGYSVIDATLIHAPELKGQPWHLIFKDERKTPLEKHLLTATAPEIDGPWSHISKPISETWSEGAAMIRVPGGFLAYYDHYTKPQHYGALFSTDLITWSDALGKINFPAGLRHGSFLQVTREEYERLAAMK
jgi:hypothetical protein